MKKILLTISFLLLSLPLFAAQIPLIWEPNQEPDLAGYLIHYGNEHRVYSQSIDVENVTEYVLSGLNAGTYYITITAYDASGNESDNSYEVVEDLKVGKVRGIRKNE